MRISDWSSDVCSSDLQAWPCIAQGCPRGSPFALGIVIDGEDQRCQALRQQDLIETSRSKASPAGKALQEGKGARGFKALGKREASGALPSPLPRPLPRPPQHALPTVLSGFRVEKGRTRDG